MQGCPFLSPGHTEPLSIRPHSSPYLTLLHAPRHKSCLTPTFPSTTPLPKPQALGPGHERTGEGRSVGIPFHFIFRVWDPPFDLLIYKLI